MEDLEISLTQATRPTKDEIRRDVEEGYLGSDADLAAGNSELNPDCNPELFFWREIGWHIDGYRVSQDGWMADDEVDRLHDELVVKAQADLRTWVAENVSELFGS